MHRYFIAAVIAMTVAITGFAAAPARADTDDLAKALAGIAALAIIGKAINDRNDRDHVTHNQHIYRPHTLHPKPLPQRVHRYALPERCIRQLETHRGQTRKVFGARCLERHYRHANRLPRNCARQIETHRGWRWVYGARCLRENGYRVARY